jgi:hypothetical protein
MKANAPEKIYIDKYSSFACETNKDNIEYIRTDAFIKKAVEWLRNEIYTFDPRDTEKMIENFKKAMML